MGGGALNTEFGQILIDPSMAVYQLNRPFFTGRVMFGIPVPNDPSLIGQKYYSQALVYGYRVMQMCNGLDCYRTARPIRCRTSNSSQCYGQWWTAARGRPRKPATGGPAKHTDSPSDIRLQAPRLRKP